MQLFLEVAKDLIGFALGKDTSITAPDSREHAKALPAPRETLMVPAQTQTDAVLAAVAGTDELVTEVPPKASQAAQDYQPLHIEPEQMYVTVPTSHCFMRPVRAFDTVIATFSYGEAVLVGRLEGRWASVQAGSVHGWVLKDTVTPDRTLVYPSFIAGVVYEPKHPETVKLRTLIHDMFGAVDLLLPLQDVEYVSYKLQTAGRTVSWPAERPRIAGRWQQVLKGVRGVHIGILPMTGSVLEYQQEDGTGAVLHVDAVHPDESIVVSGIDEQVPGRFIIRNLTKEAWMNLRPIFIDVT